MLDLKLKFFITKLWTRYVHGSINISKKYGEYISVQKTVTYNQVLESTIIWICHANSHYLGEYNKHKDDESVRESRRVADHMK